MEKELFSWEYRSDHGTQLSFRGVVLLKDIGQLIAGTRLEWATITFGSHATVITFTGAENVETSFRLHYQIGEQIDFNKSLF